ncbi:hypothetical protein [Arthrobacter crystallopoietes]|uniref:hypothetical protein n=1 Tax=Crystallibacter crystallopoietes TaxID=37928 RepID=UPI001ABE3293|nr:hypothetical protein [Arthrobacter crystallopoietes]QTG82575.1 hypothetical protein J5251_08645 [Arthrobacter crystallopoietes]
MRDLRNTPEWNALAELRRRGVPVETAAGLFGYSKEEVLRAFGRWAAVEKKKPKVAKDGTTMCPRCGHEAWPVRFGMWVPQPDKPAPKAVMAGCVIGPDEPDWACQNEECGYEWRVDSVSRAGHDGFRDW